MAVRVPETLTGRQGEVYRRVAEGQSRPQIAEALGITTRTVDFHLERILIKLELDSPPMRSIMRHAFQAELLA